MRAGPSATAVGFSVPRAGLGKAARLANRDRELLGYSIRIFGGPVDTMERARVVKFSALGPVELLMAVEEFFGIRIPDEDTAGMSCLLDLKRYVWHRVAHGPPSACRTQRCFYRMRRDICRLLGVERSNVRPGTSWKQILRKPASRGVWKGLHKMGVFPRECWRLGFWWPGLLVATVFAGAALKLWMDFWSGVRGPGAGGLATCIFALVAWASGFRRAWPRFRTTIGESAKLLAAREHPLRYPPLEEADRPWSFDEVGAAIERLAMEAGGLEDLNDTAVITD